MKYTLPLVGPVDIFVWIYIAICIISGMAIAVSSLGIIIKLSLILFHFLTIFYNFVDMKIKLLHLVVSYNFH